MGWIKELIPKNVRRHVRQLVRRQRQSQGPQPRRIHNFHFPMIHDRSRNAVYEHALQQFVTPATTVLEIGTGSGILAMLAARAGARHVYTCEVEQVVVECAQQNVTRNGFADRVTIIHKKSTDLVIGVDLPERADLLVSEILANDLLGEGVLPATEDAKARLLTPDAHILPAQIAVRGALVGGPEWSELCRMEEVCGLDLTAFNRLAPRMVQIQIRDQTLDDAMSDDVELFRFDLLTQAHYPTGQQELTLRARRDGVVNGLLQWIWFGFSDELQYHNRPPRRSCWNTLLHVFADPLRVRAGELIHVNVAHDRRTVRVWPSRASVTSKVGGGLVSPPDR